MDRPPGQPTIDSVMQKATGYQHPAGRPLRRRGQLPRYVLWLALLIAIAVAALGAALTRTPAKGAALTEAVLIESPGRSPSIPRVLRGVTLTRRKRE